MKEGILFVRDLRDLIFLIARCSHLLFYQKYGQRRIQEEGGRFGDRGYVAYLGTKSEIRSIMDRNLSEGQLNQGLCQKRNTSMEMGGVRF